MPDPSSNPVEDAPADPAALLPEQSLLTLDEYLAMQRTIGNRVCFEIVYQLVHREEGASAATLEEAVTVAVDDIQGHLEALVDSGLLETRRGPRSDSDGTYEHYRATELADTLLQEGIMALVRREWDVQSTYSSPQ